MTQLYLGDKLLISDPKAVLFDKDGTLVDIHHYWVSMIKIRSRIIVEKYFSSRSDSKSIEDRLIDLMGVDLSSFKMKPQGPIGVKPRHYIVTLVTELINKFGVDINDDQTEIIFKEVDELTSENLLPLIRLLPGVRELLESLAKNNVDSFIVTTDITSRAKASFRAIGMEYLFKKIIGGDLVNSVKPAPDLVLAALEESECDISRCVVVGDHPVDIQMGLAAGCSTNIAVLTGISSKDAFDNINCTIVNDLTQISLR